MFLDGSASIALGSSQVIRRLPEGCYKVLLLPDKQSVIYPRKISHVLLAHRSYTVVECI